MVIVFKELDERRGNMEIDKRKRGEQLIKRVNVRKSK
jgi:hypothetical protein